MKRNLLTSIILPFLTVGAIEKQAHIPIPLRISAKIIAPPVRVAEIPVPAGYQRISTCWRKAICRAGYSHAEKCHE